MVSELVKVYRIDRLANVEESINYITGTHGSMFDYCVHPEYDTGDVLVYVWRKKGDSWPCHFSPIVKPDGVSDERQKRTPTVQFNKSQRSLKERFVTFLKYRVFYRTNLKSFVSSPKSRRTVSQPKQYK